MFISFSYRIKTLWTYTRYFCGCIYYLARNINCHIIYFLQSLIIRMEIQKIPFSTKHLTYPTIWRVTHLMRLKNYRKFLTIWKNVMNECRLEANKNFWKNPERMEWSEKDWLIRNYPLQNSESHAKFQNRSLPTSGLYWFSRIC